MVSGGDGLRIDSGESAEFPTSVKEVMTLLVNVRQSISNVMGVRFARGIGSVWLAFKQRI
jgi:hypothetical protein